MKVQVTFIGTVEVDEEDYKEGFREQEDLGEDDDIDSAALTKYILEQVLESTQEGDMELDAEFRSATVAA